MILTWMVYVLLVSVLVAVGARGLEEVGRAARLPRRFVWVAALLATLVLTALAPFRAGLSEPAVRMAGVELGAASPGDAAEAARPHRVERTVERTVAALRRAVAWPVHAVAGSAEGRAAGALGFGWLGLVVGVLGLGIATRLRYGAARRGWPLRDLAGASVRVAPAAGPAVLGLFRPEIVVPAWLLETSPEEQRLVVLHEGEHVRARDSLTLAAGWLAAALVPWNPVLWWMLARLRLAVELDCDARVLRHDVRPAAYGSMLIDLAGRGSGLSLGAPALAGSPSILERRLFAMTRSFSRSGWARAVGLGALGALALIAACDTPLPTSTEIDEMDVASAETRAQELGLVEPGSEGVTYYVDGVEVTAEEARSIPGDRLARVTIRGGDEGAVIRLRSRSGHALETRKLTLEASDDALALGPSIGFDGLILIDGVAAEPSALRDLRPSQIESIEVVKGPAAAVLHEDGRARNGVIHITTKSGGVAR